MDEEEKICRYCFEGPDEGVLIAPCRCAGGSKYVHLHCLRSWQRMALVTQPTHPALYRDDPKINRCTVCLSEFTSPPPTRHELMVSFTGAELAALVETNCIIGSERAFSEELEAQLSHLDERLRKRHSAANWIRGVYLITSVEKESGVLTLPVPSHESLIALRSRIGPDLTIATTTDRYRLVGGGSLLGVTQEDLPAAFAALRPPATLVFASVTPKNCGDDHITALGLCRPVGLEAVPRPGLVEQAINQLCARYPAVLRVEITHFLGGPCEPDEICGCVVLGGPFGGIGWTVQKDLPSALQLACARAARRFGEVAGDIGGGQTVRLVGLQAAPELNGMVGVALRFDEIASRWEVRLANGEGRKLRPVNLQPLEGGGGRVYCVWGAARWTRTQLLAEMARGHWGLTRATVADLIARPDERWLTCLDRLAFAPETAMTERFMHDASRAMATHFEARRVTTEATVRPAEDEDEGLVDGGSAA
eukprot:gnl/Spiro4/2174_TR1042_c0_g1_i1.p1 gnl/Spiro4/2174_TR1042_c0_g1~~gnl/Spiro4/2174_TR1042_c0_g1_i1.p1  ORF type:complete len:479 (+),score=82.97 gnl/Spiro4/2174_TR1042_c0_g1_i1:60-1496(+)